MIRAIPIYKLLSRDFPRCLINIAITVCKNTLEHAANIVRKRAINNFARVSLGVLASQIYKRACYSRGRESLSSWLLNKFRRRIRETRNFSRSFRKNLKKEGGKRRGGERERRKEICSLVFLTGDSNCSR